MDNRFKFIITFERELFIFDSIETTINNDNATTRRRRRRRVGRLCRISIEICISRCTGNDVIVEYREPCIRIIKIPRENYTIRPFILSNKCNNETKGEKDIFFYPWKNRWKIHASKIVGGQDNRRFPPLEGEEGRRVMMAGRPGFYCDLRDWRDPRAARQSISGALFSVGQPAPTACHRANF